MVHSRPTLPSGHGELILSPGFDEWAGLVESNRAASAAWSFSVAGHPVAEMRALARAEALAAGERFSRRLGIAVRAPAGEETPLVATGHQPLLYHTGVWVKDFLLERLAEELGADSIDVVVDTDGFNFVSVTAPCMKPGIARCQQYLAIGTAGSCFSSTPVPSHEHIADFCSSASSMLATLPSPAVKRHFSAFCEALSGASDDARNMAELVTIARRRYEATVGTGYLEAPLTDIADTESFRRFVVHLAFDRFEFSSAYNAELQHYRALTKTRSAAQPFPDLAVANGAVELPFWVIEHGQRKTLWAAASAGETVTLRTDVKTIATLPADFDDAVALLSDAGLVIAPKALSLTLFMRMFVCDLFIHGIGGGRYDRVTDGVIRRYFDVEPPAFTVASLTMYLPLGAQVVTEEDVSTAKARLNRLDHNPDALLGEVEFDSEEEGDRALALATEKSELVASIRLPDADKKTIGIRIREVNQELGQILGPVRAQYATELETLEIQLKESDILTDRTYPFCFWDPAEVADKVR